MNRTILAVIVAVAATITLAQTAHAGPAAPAVPTKITVPDGHKPFLVGHATDLQIYACTTTVSGYK